MKVLIFILIVIGGGSFCVSLYFYPILFLLLAALAFGGMYWGIKKAHPVSNDYVEEDL